MVFPAEFRLGTLNGSNGFTLNGINSDDYSAWSLSDTGDINGDGIDDLIIGSSSAIGYTGQSYVVFGRSNGFASNLELSLLDGSNGFTLNGIKYSYSGSSVNSAGDINGDGLNDLIIGASGADKNISNDNSGQSYVVFGRSNGFSSTLELSALDGRNGFTLNGINRNDRSGSSVSSAGDVNGDGLDDIIIGAPRAEPTGQNYVVFGRSNGFSSIFELSTLNGSNGFTLNGGGAGSSVSSAGDINGDDLDDIIIGAPWADPNYSGQSYVVFGRSNGFSSSFELSALNGSNGFTLNGINTSDNSGSSVSSAGDINGDGLDDIIIGARLADPNSNNSGQSYVVFGRSNGFSSTLDLSALDGKNGFTLNGINANDRSGFSVSSAGDINGDDLDDIIIGAPRAEPNGRYSGQSYVVFGRSNGFASNLNLSSLNGVNGFALNGFSPIILSLRSYSGSSVSGVGDVNDDGVDDLIIGAPYSGQSYVVFGDNGTINGSLTADTLQGTSADDILRSLDGNDSLVGKDGNDSLNGGKNRDTLMGGAGNDTLNGGLGVDFYRFNSPHEGIDTINDYSVPNDNILVNRHGFGGGLSLGTLNVNQFTIGSSAKRLSHRFIYNDLNGNLFYDSDGIGINSAIQIASLGSGLNLTHQDFVIFDPTSDFSPPFQLSNLNGSNGFTINGINELNGVFGLQSRDQSGASASSAGDINGDGFDDLIIGAPGADTDIYYYQFGLEPTRALANNAGQSYVVFGNSDLSSTLELSNLDGSNGFSLNGISFVNDGDASGYSVSSAGDINGDGFDDLLIGAPGADTASYYVGAGSGGGKYLGNNAGQSYVVFGQSDGFSSSLELSSLDGSNGFALNGTDVTFFNYDNGSGVGVSVSSAGDVNGDGLDDLIIGAPDADLQDIYNYTENTGQSYVVFGNSIGFSSTLELSNLDGSNGFVLKGFNLGDRSGKSVSSAGDINGDSIDDLIISAPNADPNGNNSGQSYVVFGNSNGFNSSLELSGLNGGNGFIINGVSQNDLSGTSISNAGDVNGDGIDDLIIGAPNADPNGNNSGQSYVVFGKSNAFSSTVELSSLDGSNGFTINGINSDDKSGFSVSSAGDFNNDGINDLIIGAPKADPNGLDSGEIYVVFGTSLGFSSTIELSSLDGSNGFAISGIKPGDESGFSVSSVGDFNRDGFDDIIIGAPEADPNGFSSGKSYVIYGRSTTPIMGTSADDMIRGSALEDTLVGLSGNDTLIGGKGDDTISGGVGSDLLEGGFGDDTYNVENVGDRVVEALNRGTDLVRSLISYTLPDHVENLTLTGNNNLNGTGNALDNSITGNSGNNQLTGRAGNDTLTGKVGNDTLIGGNGNDTLIGGVGSDTLIGGGGDDFLDGATSDFLDDSLIGGIGNDTYLVNTPSDVVLEAVNQGIDNVQTAITFSLSTLSHVERLTLLGSNNVDGLGNNLNNLIIGNNGNNLLNGNHGNDALQGGNGNDTLFGREGNDILGGSKGHDLLRDFSGNDLLFGALGNDTLNGNSGNDTLNGNRGKDILRGGIDGQDVLVGGQDNDVLIGLADDDTLTGGTGQDKFRYFSPNEGTDLITDYSVADDSFLISSSGFGGGLALGVLQTNQFSLGASASTTAHRFIYRSSTGDLFYDRDGTGASAQQQIATLSTGLALTNQDFIIGN